MKATTPQAEMKNKLESLGLPYREIQVYGSQITVECISRESCVKFMHIVGKFARIRGLIKTVSYTGRKGRHSGSNLNPKVIDVWRLYAAV